MKLHSNWREQPIGSHDGSPTRFSVGSVENGEGHRRLPHLTLGAGLIAIAFAAIVSLCIASPGLAGSERPEPPYNIGEILKPLNKTVVDALRAETGVEPFYILVFTREGPVVIGQPPGVEIDVFENQEALWQAKGEITVEEVNPTTSSVRFRASPGTECRPVPWCPGGSCPWYCPPN